MKLSIKSIIYQAIIEDRWLDISYVNREKENTDYYIGIIDIDIKKGTIICDIFNPYKNNNCLMDGSKKKLFINIDGIQHAKVLEQSYYPIPEELKKRIEADADLAKYLEVETMDNDILRYLSDCYRLDNDPYLKETVMINGIDRKELHSNHFYKLDDEQFDALLNQVFKKSSKYEAEKVNRFSELAINYFSIDIQGKQYVVAYRKLSLNFKNRTLKMDDKTTINKSFLIEEDKKVTLGMYLDMNPDEFCSHFDEKAREYIELIKQNFHNGEIVNTRPTIFLVTRNIQRGVDMAFEAISQMDREGKLTQPLKSFFGRNRSGTGTSKDPNIVVFNKDKINIDQMRVVYNSMVNHVTYVKGPPGTGKTETIFNVLLSAYANDKTVLVCSNNNHPVNDIFAKMTKSLVRKVGKDKVEEQILFPIMRLGNNEELKETINKLKVILEYANEHKDARTNDSFTQQNKNKALSGFKELKELLKKYEERQELEDKILKLEKIMPLAEIDVLSGEIDKQIKLQKQKLESTLVVNEEDVTKYAISASEDINFQNFVYYSSLARIKKILSTTNKDLREILAIEDSDEAVYKFNKYLKNDKNLKRFLDIFPIIVCTNLSSEKLGEARPHFDLCIMDEAGQCNIASSLIPIVRADDLLLVGDTNQLQPVTVIETDINDYLMEKYNIKPDYDYVHNSILSTMLRKDNNSKSILLRYHYRCGKRIAGFVNQRFYEQQLKLLNNNDGSLTYIDVHNTFNPESRNAYDEEARSIVNIIKKNDYHDVGIVTPFVNQAALINQYLIDNKITDVKAGTIHTLQGSEKSVIIMSAALSVKTGQKTMDWIKNNHELINVAVTRAKEQFVFVGDKKAIDVLSGDEDNDIKVLSDYVYKNGELVVPKSDVTISTDFSNNSQSEKDFFATITPYFNKRGTKMRIERNVPVKDAIKSIHSNDLAEIGQKEFDVIVQASYGMFNRYYRTVVVFEIDGGEHIGSKATAARDRIKEKICANYGIKIIRIANNQVKDYELIISLFECIIKNIPDIEKVDGQLSLFEETN